jgi:hypothetical protein
MRLKNGDKGEFHGFFPQFCAKYTKTLYFWHMRLEFPKLKLKQDKSTLTYLTNKAIR